MTTRGTFDDAQMGVALSNNMGAALQPFALAAGIAKVPLTLTPASVAAATTVEQTFTLLGVQPGDAIDVTPPGLTAGVSVVGARISANNTVALQFVNTTAGALTPLAGSYIFVIFR
jgi:hypothetical protein